MPQMRTISLLFWCYLGGRFTGRHRIASHRVFKSRRRENESQADRLSSNVLRTYPSIGRNKHKCSRVEIAFILPKPNVSLAALNQQDFILRQVSVFRYRRPWGKLFPTCHKVLRAVIFRADLQQELGGGGNAGVGVNASSPQLAFILFQQKWFRVRFCARNCTRLICLRERSGQADHDYDDCCKHTPNRS